MIVSASFIVVVAFDDGIVCAANSSSIGGTVAYQLVGSTSSRGNAEAEAETEAAS